MELGGQRQQHQYAANRRDTAVKKELGSRHPTGLTDNLLRLFAPRPPPAFKPPVEKRKCLPYSGIASFLENFADPTEPDYAPPAAKILTLEEKKANKTAGLCEKGAKKLEQELPNYDPASNPKATSDAYKTLFVGRLSYETTKDKLKNFFERYGPIRKVEIIHDNVTDKPRGYAFVEFHHSRDMKDAYKYANELKLDNRRILVDVERGRTIEGWKPRRLGGGLGSKREAPKPQQQAPQQAAPQDEAQDHFKRKRESEDDHKNDQRRDDHRNDHRRDDHRSDHRRDDEHRGDKRRRAGEGDRHQHRHQERRHHGSSDRRHGGEENGHPQQHRRERDRERDHE